MNLIELLAKIKPIFSQIHLTWSVPNVIEIDNVVLRTFEQTK